MFTRCPQCRTVYPLTAASVSHAKGLVQCGQCHQDFSALNLLFDNWPSGQAYSPAPEADPHPPVLESASGVHIVGFIDSDPIARIFDSSDAGDTGSHPKRLAWGLATALLVLLTIANTAWTFREPLLENPDISAWMEQLGWLQAKQTGPLKEPQKIQLVSHDMHAHPTRSGILVLSITFVNLAQTTQRYPELELTLLDATSQPVARRRLKPTDYLRPGIDTSAGLATDVYLPVLLELGDPGKQAVGFEVQFL